MDNKWTKVQEHPVLECGVMTKEDGQVKVTALFKSNNSTIMVYNKEDNYVFMRTEGRLNELTGMSIDYGKGGGIVLTTKP